MREYQRAKEIDPENPNVYMRIGRLYTQLGRYDEALKELSIASKLTHGHGIICRDIAVIYKKIGMIDEAINEYKKGLRQSPFSPGLYADIGDLYFEKGLFDDALRAFKRARKINPGYPLSENGMKMLSSGE